MTTSSRDTFWDHLLGVEPQETVAETVKTVDEDIHESVAESFSNRTYEGLIEFRDQEQDEAKREAAYQLYRQSDQSKSETEHALSEFRKILPENPRAIKRIINAIQLRKVISISEGATLPLDVLVRWTILEQTYPAVVDALIESPHNVSLLVKDQNTPEEQDIPENGPDAIKHSANLDSLKKLLALKAGGHFNANLIEEIKGGS